MNAGPYRRRLAFLVDIVGAVADEGPSKASGNHVCPEVEAIGATKRDGAAVTVESMRLVCYLAPAVGAVFLSVSPSTGDRAIAANAASAKTAVRARSFMSFG